MTEMSDEDEDINEVRRHRSTEENLRTSLETAERRFEDERDRRYAEVAQEREKALKIKETADLKALDLASEIQKYKDEKANNLREQIASERGLYATKSDLLAAIDKTLTAVKPATDYVTGQIGRSSGTSDMWTRVFALVAAAASIIITIKLLVP